jgi:hypothetical protein
MDDLQRIRKLEVRHIVVPIRRVKSLHMSPKTPQCLNVMTTYWRLRLKLAAEHHGGEVNLSVVLQLSEVCGDHW